MKQFSLYGCPLHQGVGNLGVTTAIDVLIRQFPMFNIEKIDEIFAREQGSPTLKNLDGVVNSCNAIAKKGGEIIKSGDLPLFIGGDHSASIGSISAVCEHRKNLGLLWVDSHSDINTDATTSTGNIHGMPVAALLNLGNHELTSIHFEGEKILPHNVVLFGLRDVDPPEQDIIDKLGVLHFTCDDIEQKGLLACLVEAQSHLSTCNGVHLSFDLDSINPDIIKGVSVPVCGGFTTAQATEIIQFCLDKLDLSSIDIVEYNPANDTDGYTLTFLGELIKQIKRL